MKTITLTDEAYTRLKEWKSRDSDSFSRVILRLIPDKGTLSQMLDDVQHLPALNEKQAKLMEESAAWGRDPRRHREPWTT